MIDGNLAALKRYEEANDRYEMAQSTIDVALAPLLTQMEELVIEIMGYADYFDTYDFGDYIEEEIDNTVKSAL